jgi:hypothetical protein
VSNTYWLEARRYQLIAFLQYKSATQRKPNVFTKAGLIIY